MDILQLKYFEKVAHLESITGAAAELGVSQSQISKSIAKLESDVGTKLFNRVGRQIRLNEQGSIFLQTAKRVINEIETCNRQLRYHTESHTGRISICLMGPTLAPAISQAILDYSGMYKSISFQLATYKEAKMTAEELSGFDFLIARRDFLPKGFDGLEMPPDDTYVLMSYTNKLAKRPYLDLADLADQELVVSQYIGVEDEQSAYNMFMMNNVSPNIRIIIEDSFPQDESIFKHILIASSDNYVGLVPGSYKPMYEKNTNYVMVPLRAHRSANNWDTIFAWNRSEILDPVANEFLNHVQVNVNRLNGVGDK